MYKLEFYVPESHCEEVKNAVFAAGAGQQGNWKIVMSSATKDFIRRF